MEQVPQLTRVEFAALDTAERAAAIRDGRAAQIMGAPIPTLIPEGQLTREDLATMTRQQITTARKAGQLDELLRRTKGH